MELEAYQNLNFFLSMLDNSKIFGVQDYPPSRKLNAAENRLMAHYRHVRSLKLNAVIEKPEGYLL